SEKKQFVWKGLNLWYYWQQEVPQLGDDYFDNDQAFQNYLIGFTDAETLFNTLLYDEDRFSWFIDDYEKQEEAFKGISKSFGFSFGLIRLQDSNDIFGYVQYVVPDTPAEEAGLERGDLFTAVNGTQLTVNNYMGLLDDDRYTLTMATIHDNTISETDETVSMTAEEIHENPVFMAKV